MQILRRMLEEGSDGFEGGMSAKKYMTITGASKATATRDLQDLVEKYILVRPDRRQAEHALSDQPL
jgi:Fic family protein